MPKNKFPRDPFIYRVFTEKGRFHFCLDALNVEAGRKIAQETFTRLGLPPIKIVHAKIHSPHVENELVTMNQDGQVSAAKGLWHALGRDVEFEATLILNSTQNDS